MKKILITGAGSYVGESVRNYILKTAPGEFLIDSVDTMGDNWKKADYSQYDTVFHVAGIAHVNADPKMEPLYYKVNRDLTIEVAKHAKASGVKQFIFMSSQIVFHESQSLKTEMLTRETKEQPNGFYGDSKLQAELGLKALVQSGSEQVGMGKNGTTPNQSEQIQTSSGELVESNQNQQMKICILRPPMIYGPNSKGNFLRLGWLATKTPIFPCWHNRRSMLYVDNLGEFVKQAVLRDLEGTFYPQNKELADTVDIVKFFAKKYNHKIWISRIFNPFVWMGSFVLQPLNKMFASYYYDPEMSKVDFDYQLVSQEESFKTLEVTEANRKLG